MPALNERINELITAANKLLVSVGNEPLAIPEVVEPTYRTPTIRDLLKEPRGIECEYSHAGETWHKGLLVAVDASQDVDGFFVEHPHDKVRCWFRHCRIPAEPALPPEKPEWELIDGKLFKGEWSVELTDFSAGQYCIMANGPTASHMFDDLGQAMGLVNERAGE